mmetsp:Transcript_835/g.2473  ORF Transcript_835/g.2473 Transcript_835/m.2473 type:complete len:279 (+) Transcript_835:801-1637(+)
MAVLGVARHVGTQSLDPADQGLRALTKVLEAEAVVKPGVGALQGSQSLAGGILRFVSVGMHVYPRPSSPPRQHLSHKRKTWAGIPNALVSVRVPRISHPHGETHEGVIAEELDAVVEDQHGRARSLQRSDTCHRCLDGLEDSAQELDGLVCLDHRHAPLLCSPPHLCAALSSAVVVVGVKDLDLQRQSEDPQEHLGNEGDAILPREVADVVDGGEAPPHLKDLPQDRHDEVHRLDAKKDAQWFSILLFQEAVTLLSLSQSQPGSPGLAPAERNQRESE